MEFKPYYAQLTQGNLDPVSLFTGSEVYYIENTLKYIESQFLNENYRAMNWTLFEGSVDLDQLESALSTLPFFDSRRIVVVSRTGILKQAKAETEERLLSIMENIPPSSALIFYETETDNRKKIGKWLKKNGAYVEFNKLDQGEFLKWMKKRFKYYNCEIALPMMHLLAERVDYLPKESEKTLYDVDQLIHTITDRRETITAEMIDQYAPLPIEHNIFKLMDAVTTANLSSALTILNQFIDAGEPPIRIFALISQQFRSVFKLKHLLAAGHTSQTAAVKLEMHPYAAKRLATFTKKYSEAQLFAILSVLEDTDSGLKSTGIEGKWLIEKSLMDIASIQNRS
jgi:DNA polymerase-3 subunit delta